MYDANDTPRDQRPGSRDPTGELRRSYGEDVFKSNSITPELGDDNTQQPPEQAAAAASASDPTSVAPVQRGAPSSLSSVRAQITLIVYVNLSRACFQVSSAPSPVDPGRERRVQELAESAARLQEEAAAKERQLAAALAAQEQQTAALQQQMRDAVAAQHAQGANEAEVAAAQAAAEQVMRASKV